MTIGLQWRLQPCLAAWLQVQRALQGKVMQEMLQEINCASDMQETGNKTLAIMGSESSDFSGPLGREISPPPIFKFIPKQ